MSVKLLDASLTLLDAVPTGQRVIFHMHFNRATNEILTAGASSSAGRHRASPFGRGARAQLPP